MYKPPGLELPKGGSSHIPDFNGRRFTIEKLLLGLCAREFDAFTIPDVVWWGCKTLFLASDMVSSLFCLYIVH